MHSPKQFASRRRNEDEPDNWHQRTQCYSNHVKLAFSLKLTAASVVPEGRLAILVHGAVAWPVRPIPDGVPIEFLRPTFNLLSVMFARLRYWPTLLGVWSHRIMVPAIIWDLGAFRVRSMGFATEEKGPSWRRASGTKNRTKGFKRHGSMRTPGLSRPRGSSAFFAARSASANSGGRWRSYHGR